MKARLTLLSVLLLAAVSCENEGENTVWDDPHFIRVSVTQEAVVKEGKEVALQWFTADSIRVFDTDKNSAVLVTNNYTDGKGVPEVFFTKGWTAGTPFYAVRPVTEKTVCTAEGVEGLEISASQEVSLINAPGVLPSVGEVTGNRTAYKASLKNTSGSVIFAMVDSTVASVKIESLGGEPVAGLYDVDFSMLANGEDGFWSLHEGAQSSTSVVVTPADGSAAITSGNTFQAGTFYADVLPQTYSKGLKFTATFLDGKTTEQILVGEDGTLIVPRSGTVSAVKAMDETLPDEFEISLNFVGNWPFNEDIYPAASQAQSGKGDKYTYTYAYKNGESDFTADFNFYFYGNKVTYVLEAAQLVNKANNSRFMTPAVYGRYLKSVKVTVGNGSAYPKTINIVGMDWANLVKDVKAHKDQPAEIVFPYGDVRTDKNTSYYIQFANATTQIKTLTLVYSTKLD